MSETCWERFCALGPHAGDTHETDMGEKYTQAEQPIDWPALTRELAQARARIAELEPIEQRARYAAEQGHGWMPVERAMARHILGESS